MGQGTLIVRGRALAAGLFLLALGACAPQPEAPASPAEPAEPPLSDAGTTTPRRDRTPPPADAMTCGAAEFKHLIGTSADDLPFDALPPKTRIVCHNCMVTKDLRLDRLNIYLTEARIVKSVSCG